MKKTRITIAGILLAAFLLALPALALEPGTATVKADALRFREGPSLDAEIIDLAPDGTEVEVLEDLGEWCLVRWNGREGYMNSRYLVQDGADQQGEAPVQEPEAAQAAEPAPEPAAAEPAPPADTAASEQAAPAEVYDPAKVGILTGDAVRFRAGASLEADVYGYFYCGKRVSVLALEGDWYRVESGGRIGYVFAEYLRVQEPGEAPAVNGDLAASVIALAEDNLGVPYVYGGSSPDGFDCSGLVYYCFLKCGVKLNRTATGQYQQGVYVAREDLEPGDLVFFVSPGTQSIGHVGIDIGDGEFIHASTGSRKIMVSELSNSYFDTNYYGARRITE